MKKVLIISYYWPPSGGSGVQRWLKFVKYLPNLGWKPIVYTPENSHFDVQDFDLLNDIPDEVETWKRNIWEPYALKDKIFGQKDYSESAGVILNKGSFKNKFLNWVRGNIFIPDPKIYWVKPSIKYLSNRIKKEGIDYIITTGPPHSMHLIGLGLKEIMPKLKWVADFRDPWSELDMLSEFSLLKRSRLKHQNFERKVLQNADISLAVSESWKNDLERLGSSNVAMITNGFDAEDFNVRKKSTGRFIIGHYGLLNHLRNPSNLWRSLSNLCEKNKNFSEKLEIQLSGNIDGDIILEIESFPSLRNKVKRLGYLSHSEVLNQYNEASILLLLIFNSESGKGNYPGKIFEYFAAKRPILAFGPNSSDTKSLITTTQTGLYFSYEEQHLEDVILNVFEGKTKFNFSDTTRFSRQKLTVDLSDLLNNL